MAYSWDLKHLFLGGNVGNFKAPLFTKSGNESLRNIYFWVHSLENSWMCFFVLLHPVMYPTEANLLDGLLSDSSWFGIFVYISPESNHPFVVRIRTLIWTLLQDILPKCQYCEINWNCFVSGRTFREFDWWVYL